MISSKHKVLSPHLSIYKPQISSVISILHRITGVVLFLGLLTLLWWMVSLLTNPNPMDTTLWKYFSTDYGLVALAAWSFCLFFHLYNGIRYLFWGKGKGFDINHMTITGYAALLLSICSTAFVWYISLY